MGDNKSDSDDCSDNELPLSSISDLLLLTNNRKVINHDAQNSCEKPKVTDSLTKKYECDICAKIFFTRSLIIKHFKTSLCYPESSFYLDDDCFEYGFSSSSESSKFYTFYDLERKNFKEMYNYRISPEVEIMNVIKKNSQTSFSKNNNLNSKVYSNATNGSTSCFLTQSKMCRVSANGLSILKKHQFFNSKSKGFNCNVCNKSFKDLNILENHKLFHTKLNAHKDVSKTHNLKKDYVCSRCSKVFHKRSKIISHIFSYHQEDYYKYSCDTCANLYHPQELILHLNKKRFKCDVCPKKYSTLYRLHQHYRWHLGINKFTCQYCPMIFSKCSTYLLHEKTHTEETPFICSLCGKWFPVTSNINIHFTPDNKPFVCDICQKVFAQMSSLLSHKIVHTENEQLKDTNYNNLTEQSTSSKVLKKKVPSEQCDKSLLHLSTLDLHTKTHQSNDSCTHNSYFKCNLCQKIFSDLKLFVNHRCTLCKCKCCPKVLSNTFSLKRHYIKVHKINPFEGNICKK